MQSNLPEIERRRAELASLCLNDDELAMLALVAAGHTNAQIGELTGRKQKTIINRLTVVYSKLCARNRADAIAIYLRAGGGSGGVGGGGMR